MSEEDVSNSVRARLLAAAERRTRRIEEQKRKQKVDAYNARQVKKARTRWAAAGGESDDFDSDATLPLPSDGDDCELSDFVVVD
jgi:hypothetical protein